MMIITQTKPIEGVHTATVKSVTKYAKDTGSYVLTLVMNVNVAGKDRELVDKIFFDPEKPANHGVVMTKYEQIAEQLGLTTDDYLVETASNASETTFSLDEDKIISKLVAGTELVINRVRAINDRNNQVFYNTWYSMLTEEELDLED